MNDRTTVVTGARSFAGRLLLDHLMNTDGVNPIAVLSPRSDVGDRDDDVTSDRRHIVADLTEPLPDRLRRELGGVDRVFHFAWDRSLDAASCSRRNTAMVANLLDAMSDTSCFIFISTSAAGQHASSIYGATKYAMEELVLRRGGTVLVVGLITSTQAGTAYAAIRHAVCRSPFRFGFDAGYRFYPVAEEGLVRSCVFFLDDFEPGTYGAFPPGGIAAREFLAEIERDCPRFRVPLFVHSGLALSILRGGRMAGLTRSMAAEKLATFLYCDSERLAGIAHADRRSQAQDGAGPSL